MIKHVLCCILNNGATTLSTHSQNKGHFETHGKLKSSHEVRSFGQNGNDMKIKNK
jgi:hypothetical protein